MLPLLLLTQLAHKMDFAKALLPTVAICLLSSNCEDSQIVYLSQMENATLTKASNENILGGGEKVQIAMAT